MSKFTAYYYKYNDKLFGFIVVNEWHREKNNILHYIELIDRLEENYV